MALAAPISRRMTFVPLALALACSETGPRLKDALSAYTITRLPQPPASSYHVVDFNDRGEFAGVLNPTSGAAAFRYVGDAYEVLQSASPLLSDAVVAMNDSGDVALTLDRAAIWKRASGELVKLPAEYTSAAAADINNSATVLLANVDERVPVVWTATGLDTVGELRAPESPAQRLRSLAMNDVGEVLWEHCGGPGRRFTDCGWRVNSTTPRDPFAGGCPTRATHITQVMSYARAVNESGHVLGGHYRTACIYRPGATTVVLDLENVAPSLTRDSWVVGWGPAPEYTPRLVAAGETYELDDLIATADREEWTDLEFLFVNDAHEILARGSYNGAMSLAILRPIAGRTLAHRAPR